MKVRTPTDLQEFLDKDFSWRLREINQIKDAVRSSSSFAQVTLIRAGITLTYAHWEGFVKSSAEVFLGFIVGQRRRYKDLNICFYLHGISARVETMIQSKKHHRRLEALRFIINNHDQEAKFAWKDRINTKANLSSDVFESIASAIGIDSSRYATRRNLIDEQLSKSRNQIAHGQWIAVDYSSFTHLVDETLTLMRWIKTDIENAVALKSYMAIKPKGDQSK